jgi:hypothetical protein
MNPYVEALYFGRQAKKEGNQVPQIIVTADHAEERDTNGVMLRERVNAADFESERFAVNLIERLGWAVDDATKAEQTTRSTEPTPSGAEYRSRSAELAGVTR